MRRGSSDSAMRGGWPASSTRMAGRTCCCVTGSMYQAEPSASGAAGRVIGRQRGFQLDAHCRCCRN